MTRVLPLTAALLLGTAAAAHDYTLGDLVIDHPFIVATPPAAPAAGGYMRITNTGEEDDVLISARTDPARVPMVQLHAMEMDGDIMRMFEVPGGIAVPAGETVTLERGGLHVMFMQLSEGFAEVGEDLPVTLTFRDAGEVDVIFTVEPRTGSHDGHGGHGH